MLDLNVCVCVCMFTHCEVQTQAQTGQVPYTWQWWVWWDYNEGSSKCWGDEVRQHTHPGCCTISLSVLTASSLVMFSKLISLTYHTHTHTIITYAHTIQTPPTCNNMSPGSMRPSAATAPLLERDANMITITQQAITDPFIIVPTYIPPMPSSLVCPTILMPRKLYSSNSSGSTSKQFKGNQQC